MITSLDNKLVKDLVRLHQKKYREDSFLLFDKKQIESAYKHNYLKQLIYVKDIPFDFDNSIEVSIDVMNKISKKEDLTYIGVAKCIIEKCSYSNRIMILDHVQDPLNIGRIMEACLLFNFNDLILSKQCADIYNEKCLSNCKDGIFTLNISHKDLNMEINTLKDMGYKIYATGLKDNTKDMYDIKEDDKMVFILGNEGSGVSKELMDIVDATIKIDMHNIDSLNVAMAGGIIMHHFKI